MLPWITLDTATIPGGTETLRLKQRGTEFSIMLGANELMNSRLYGSEEALSTLSIEALAGRPKPKVLIGGLGMGFTLRAALGRLGGDAEVEVAELVPQVVDWARGPMAALHQGTLEDPRVTITVGDVGAVNVVLAGGGEPPRGRPRSSRSRPQGAWARHGGRTGPRTRHQRRR